MNIVLDSSVLILGLIKPIGSPGRIIDLMRSGELQLVIDDRVLVEYIDLLRRDYLKSYFVADERENIIEYLARNSFYSTSHIIIHDLPDIWDIAFLELALTEDIPLVTRNLNHFPREKARDALIFTPNDFLVSYY